jgi:hypothetical protein
MPLNSEKIEQLKKLIQNSPNFTDEEKIGIIEKIPSLNDQQIYQAINIFENEQKEMQKLMEKMENNQNLLKQFVKNCKDNYKNITNKIIKKSEEKEKISADKETEDLLKSI